MGVLYYIYRGIAVVLCILTLWELFKEKSIIRSISLGLVSVPLILRALMIK